MNRILNAVLLALITILHWNCSTQKQAPFTPKIVFQSSTLIVTQLTENSFVHTSYKQTDEFGNVPCNGLVVRNNNETIVFDTPTNDTSAEALINWITVTLHCKINAIIPTHFHDDCLGGLAAFHKHHIPSYANVKTIALAQANQEVVPQISFFDSLILPVGDETITAKFFGEGHTRDNVVGYFPSEHVMFGGCLIKEIDASKGYLGDANTAAWSSTVERVKQAYPDVVAVVPGHGAYGDQKLLDYTIHLFKTP